MGAVTVIKNPHSPSSKSCHNMMEKGLESSYVPTKEINKSKINNMKNERVSKSKANTTTISNAASKKHCLCAPTTHPGSFKCRLHRAATTTTSHKRIVSSSARHVNGVIYSKNLIFTKLVAPSQSGGVRNFNEANVHGQHGLSRFGRAALAAADAATTSSVQVQTISAALRQMSLN
ncbi:PREDICTED: uncharacterized protein LOC109235037 [Nicotiana attenuata]|uniref:Serine-rich protein-like protein n=1 Tax=Nicotiana attenuata TaxID=49451 RepID=A0A1J6HXP2_NICAT|nr:PREDICTED: uncharacterized protein LOC109235037 [Nicotiana attenuata]OIS97075.1 hypothetical protein A4A49_00200 [Nicotiana attenuata]